MSGRHVVLDLPTGSGKTNVALLAALQCKRKSKSHFKALYVVPNRTLCEQVGRASEWLATELDTVVIDPKLVRRRFDLEQAVKRANLVVSTPGLLASRLSQSSRLRDRLAVNLMIIDEFDEFLMLNDSLTEARCDVALERLLSELPPLPSLLVSATPPKPTSTEFTPMLLWSLVRTRWDPINVTVSSDVLGSIAPTARVELIEVADDYVTSCGQAISSQINRVIDRWERQEGVSISRDLFMKNLRRIASGSGANLVGVRPSTSLQRLAQQVITISRKYLFLFEDMFAGIEVSIEEVVCIRTGSMRGMSLVNSWDLDRDTVFDPHDFLRSPRVDGELATREIRILVDNRDDPEHFAPRLQRKADILGELVSGMRGSRGVVFTRYTQLSDALNVLLDEMGVPTWVVDGRLSDERQRIDSVKGFQRSPEGVLLITRGTGRRGLDIPAADYAVLYSPKEEEYIVWQEISRIRSNVGNRKPVFILGYAETAEGRRLRALGDSMGTVRKGVDLAYSRR